MQNVVFKEAIYTQFIQNKLTFSIESPEEAFSIFEALPSIFHQTNLPKHDSQKNWAQNIRSLKELFEFPKTPSSFQELIIMQVKQKQAELKMLYPDSFIESNQIDEDCSNLEITHQEKKMVLSILEPFLLTEKRKFIAFLKKLLQGNIEKDKILYFFRTILSYPAERRLDYLNKLYVISEHLTPLQTSDIASFFISVYPIQPLYTLIQLIIQQNPIRESLQNLIFNGIRFYKTFPVVELVYSIHPFLNRPLLDEEISNISKQLTKLRLPSVYLIPIFENLNLILPLEDKALIYFIIQVAISFIEKCIHNNDREKILYNICLILTTLPSNEKIYFLERVESLVLKEVDYEESLSLISTFVIKGITNKEKHIYNYNPEFIYNRNPNRFKNQEDYLKRASNAICNAANMIECHSKIDRKGLFFLLISYLSKERALLARDHNTLNASDFGARRTEEEFSTIVLHGVYENCGLDILSWIRKHLHTMLEIKQDSLKIKHRTLELSTNFADFTSLFKIEVLPREEYENALNPSKFDLSTEQGQQNCLQAEKNFQINPQLDEMNYILKELFCDVLSEKEQNSLFIRAEIFFMYQDIIHPLTKYNTFMKVNEDWLKENIEELHPFKLMEQTGVVLLHQDSFFVTKTLKTASELFEKILQWDGENLESLVNQMGIFVYLLVHNMRDHRGSAAETEWLSQSIYKALGVEVISDKDKLQDLEAFAHPLLPDFIKAYKEMHIFRKL